MHRLTILVALVVLLVPGAAHAGSNADGFGFGIIVGEPTGLDGKLWLSESTALQGAVAWSTEANTSFQIHIDYIFHEFDLITLDSGRMPLYYGIGGRYRARDNDDDDLGLRIPVGLSYMFAEAPFDLFVEIVPILDLVPDTDFDLNAAIGVRWYP